MKPSDLAKQYGCKSLKQVERETGTNYRTLIVWAETRPDLFRAACIGVAKQAERAGQC